MSTNIPTSADPFGLQMLKPTKQGGQVWFMYNTDFNDDPQVYTESASLEYVLHNVVDADGTQFTIANDAAFKAYISTTTGLVPSQTITDQQEMARRGYMQNAQDWKNVEITGQMVIFTESTTDFITLGIRGGKDVGTGAPQGCTGSRYLVEFAMTRGGLVRVRKKSWNTSVHNWLSGLASGFDATKVCGWSFKILVYNTQDVNGVNVEVWLAPLNDNHFVKVLSGVDTGQLNTDANICNCTNVGQPLTWGGPTILLQGNSGKFGFKNMSIREIEGFGATLPPIDPNPTPTPGGGGTGGGGTGTGGGGSGGGGGGGSGSGTGGTGGGGGVPVDLTPVLATPQTSYVEYGGGPNFSPLEIHTIFAGTAWNSATTTTAPSTIIDAPIASATTTQTAEPILAAPKSSAFEYHGGTLFDSATVHFIFWGSQWNTKTTPWSKTSIMAAIDKVFKSTYFDGLIQYKDADNVRIRRPKIGSIAINTTYAPFDGFTGQDLGNVIIDSINRNQVPDKPMPGAYDPAHPPEFPHHIYYIFGSHNCFPSSSFVNAASFHYMYTYAADESLYVYGYTNDMDYAPTPLTLKYMTYGPTHELIEIITDPLLEGIYSGSPQSTGGDQGEIADVCSANFTVNTVDVSGYWSNQDNACIAPTAKPTWISCASGFTWNTTTQLCERTVTTPDPTPDPNTANAVLATPKTGYVVYGGGTPIWSAMEYWVIFPGVTWNTTYDTLRGQIMDKLRALFASSYFDGLYQYGRIRRPILKGYVVIDYTLPNNPYHDVDMGDAAIYAITHYGLTYPTLAKQNIAYLMFALPTYSYSVPAAGGVHQNFDSVFTESNSLLLRVAWSVTDGGRTLDQIVASISHELVEGITDDYEFFGKGYIIKDGTPIHNVTDVFGNEMADACEGVPFDQENALVNGVWSAKYWSDEDGKCIAPTAKPTWISCPTGYTWDNTTQQCVKNGSPVPTPTPDPTPTPTPTPVPTPTPDPIPDPGTNIQTAPPILANPTTKYTLLVPPDTVDPLQFYFIFWGPTWATSTGTTQKNSIMTNMTTVFNSAYFDGLFQYGLTKRPVLKGSVISTALTINNPFDVSEPRLVINDCIAKNQVAGNRVGFENNAYVVVLPAGFHQTGYLTSSGGHTHTITTNNNDGSTYRKFWAWVSLPSAGNTQTIEEIITHELAEIVVSNEPNKGYVIKQGTPLQTTIDTYGIEIADACEDTTANRHGTLSDLTVSKYWSDQSGSCTFTTAKPTFISCPTGYTWNNATQQCEKTVTTPSGTVASAALKTQTQNAITTLINSPYFTGLYQYGLTKRPTVGTFVVNTTATISVIPNKYTTTQITALVNDSIAKNQVPAASATKKNIAYLVILPPRTGYTTGAIGVHYANEFNPTTPTTQYFQIIATASLNVTFDDFTKTISEALIGAVSQNNPGGGAGKGYNIKTGTPLDLKIQTNGDELYGPCRDDVSNNRISGNIAVAKYWSDQDGACIIPQSSTNPTPWATCHTGATFDQPTQTCKLLPGGTGGGTTPTGGGGQGYTVALANASGDDGNVPANAVDGKLDTRWSAFGKGQFLRLDLGTAKKVNKLKIAWYQGDKRSNHFEITTAEVQGGAFTSQLKSDSQQGSTALQDYAINPPNPVRYIRIIVNGNTLNDWASISEVEVWGPDVPATTPSTGTGGDPGSGGTVPGGDTGGGTQTQPPATQASYNFFDTSFSVDYAKIGLCNPVE